MILEFVWIEDYGVIKNQGFNFNPNVLYSFDSTKGELHKEINAAIPAGFFNISNDTIINISALVGANGTGKSTVLQFISSFLTYSRPLHGFIVTEKQVINKSDNIISFSKVWPGKTPKILNRLDLINNYRGKGMSPPLTAKDDTRNNPMGLRILENLVTDTRVIFYSGEVNLQHTNRVYQSLLSMSDEFENSHFTDISDIALMANDQRRYSADKAVYSGENPILAYRSGESQRFIDLMLSEYKNQIPFALDNLTLALNFNDITNIFFDSYDEMAFGPIVNLLIENLKKVKRKNSKKLIAFLRMIEHYGIGGYFNDKLGTEERANPSAKLKVNLYHHLLLRHLREQLMTTMGELTEKNKLRHFISLLAEIGEIFTTGKPYTEQIQEYFKSTQFAINYTGRLNFKAVNAFHEKMLALNLWQYDKFTMNLSEPGNINLAIEALNTFDKDSKLKYQPSTIFDLDIRGLSTGEKQFLKIFSRFIAYNLNNKSPYFHEKTFILLIDEFDIGFHPLWQRKFLKKWITFLESYINQSNRRNIKVQLILTSHSPFVVSDLPKQCINFLSKEEGEQFSKVDNLHAHHETFGANIHELYSDSFFLSGALMGDFAKSKIDALFQQLQGDDPLAEPDVVKSLMQVIGEPIIRTKLAEMYAKKIGENIEVARLTTQQEYITRRLNEIERNAPDKTDTIKKS
ncbi:MAG: AAA family ATPase [Bacteroidota bacterium]